MPPERARVPLRPRAGPLLLPEPERLLRAFLDAVADALPRSPAARVAAGGPAFAAHRSRSGCPNSAPGPPTSPPGHDAGVRLSLRLELPRGCGRRHGRARRRRASGPSSSCTASAIPTLVADAAELWAGSAPIAAFGPRARMDALLALRRAARAWPPLAPLLSAAVPDAVELADEEVDRRCSATAAGALAAAGVARALAQGAGPRAHRPRRDRPADDDRPADGRPAARRPSCPPTRCSPSTGGSRWATSELTARGAGPARRGAPAGRAAARPVGARRPGGGPPRPRARRTGKLTPVDALGAALTGTAEVDGDRVEVGATGWLEALRDRLADPEGGRSPSRPAGRRWPPPCATTSCAAWTGWTG